MTGAVTSYIDTAQIVLYLFFFFFAALIFYIRREDRREGFPLESDTDGKLLDHGLFYVPPPKTFTLHDGKTVQAPDAARTDTRDVPGAPVGVWPGAPIEPDAPMTLGVGPGSYAERADVPDTMWDGKAKIVPLRVAGAFHIVGEDPDPIGMDMVGADGVVGGRVIDAWVDQAEAMLRYFEVSVGEGEEAKNVLVPATFCDVQRGTGRIVVEAIMGGQFGGVPVTKKADQVTFLEEEKIVAYFGGGTLYADPSRSEPLL